MADLHQVTLLLEGLRALGAGGVLDEVLRETSAGARAEQAGDNSAVEAAYQHALKLDPANVESQYYLGTLSVASDVPKAIADGPVRSGARPWFPSCSAAMAMSSVSVVSNSLRSKRFRPKF